MLRSIRKGVIQESPQFGDVPLGPRSSAIPGVIIAANRTNRLGRLSVFNVYDPESIGLFKASSGAASYADMQSSVSKYRLNREASGVHFGGIQSSTSRMNRETSGMPYSGMPSSTSKYRMIREVSAMPNSGMQSSASNCRLDREVSAMPYGGTRSSVSKARFNRETSGMPYGGMRPSISKGRFNRETSGMPYGGMRSSISKGRMSNIESTKKHSVTFLQTGKNRYATFHLCTKKCTPV